MNRLPSSVRQYVAALRMLLVFTVICGIAYPVVMWGVAQAAFKNQADGSLVTYQGQGRRIQPALPGVRQREGRPAAAVLPAAARRPRPSGASNDYGCDPGYSAAANLGAEQPDPGDRCQAAPGGRSRRSTTCRSRRSRRTRSPSSGSGLDPDISPQNADIQVDRVAAARHLPVSEVQKLVNKYTQGREHRLPGRAPGRRPHPEHRPGRAAWAGAVRERRREGLAVADLAAQ